MNSLSLFLMLHSLAILPMPGRAFWPYFAGTVLLAVGLMVIAKNEARQAQGMDRAVVFGPLFLAVPMGVFGADHFIAPRVVAAMVPSWIPGHLFWTYLVGAALIAAAFSIVIKKHAALAATLLGFMIFSFVLLIHMPNVARFNNRFALVVLLRDLSFSGGALAFATTQMKQRSGSSSRKMLALLRALIAVPALVFGVQHFLHPQFVPVIPLNLLMPLWIPGRLALSYITGAVLIACGLSMVLNWRARLAATWLGIIVFLIVMLVYLPMVIAAPADIGNGLNYFVDTLAFSGASLVLAGALPRDEAHTYQNRSTALSSA